MKERLDVLLVKRGLAESREKAKAIIMSGIVPCERSERGTRKAKTFDADGANRGTWIYLKICEPRRSETGEGDDAFRSDAGSKGLYGRRRVHRRIYRLYAAE